MSNKGNRDALGRPLSFSSEHWGFDSGLGNRRTLEENDLSRFHTAKEEFLPGTVEEEDAENPELDPHAEEYEDGEGEQGEYDETEYYDTSRYHYDQPEETKDKEEDTEAVEEDVDPQSYTPNSVGEIEEKVYVSMTPDKGRCLHARGDLKPGDIIFIEKPVMVAIPSVDPELWEQLSALHAETPMDLPPIWHLAALCSLTQLGRAEMAIIGDKWVPDPNKEPSEDALRVLTSTGLRVNPHLYERFLQAWRFNSFGHHTETDGLVLYDRISMMAHNCNSSSCWHYGEGDSFVLRSRQFIAADEELTISYIGDEDLFKSIPIRREKLSGWQFTCHCERCGAVEDPSRGFRCPDCGSGTSFLTTDEKGDTSSSSCTVCQKSMGPEKITQYLEFEEAYIARLDETGKDDLNDAELVLCEAQRVFTQHWTLFALHTTLFEGRKEEGLLDEAIYHQEKRIQYVLSVLPKATYTLAWLYEELGDLMSTRINPKLHDSDEEPEEPLAITNHQRNLLTRVYEDGMNLLLILCGDNHDYTLAIYKRLERINEIAEASR